MTTASNTNSHNVNDDEYVDEDDVVHHDSDILVNGNLRFL